MNYEIIRQVQEDVEFFTITATGESGMSISGLARLCGVGHDAVTKILQRLVTSSCPEFLKPLQAKELRLVTSSDYHNITIIKDEFCAVIIEWYAFESQRPTQEARFALRKFTSMGIRSWIQNITGWQQPQPQTKTQIELLAEIAVQMVGLEKKQEQQADLLKRVMKVVGTDSNILAGLLANKIEAEEQLRALPSTEEKPVEISLRNKINWLVRQWVFATSGDYQFAWRMLYKNLYYRYGYDVRARCRHSKLTKLDQIEKDGMAHQLFLIASELLK